MGRKSPQHRTYVVGVDRLLPARRRRADRSGMRLVTKGHELTTSMIARVRNYAAIDSGVAEPIHVFVAAPAAAG